MTPTAGLDFGRDVCGSLSTAESREWLCTNGIGGFAAGTVGGLLTRRYHGLLVAALKPPVGRTLLVTKLDETARYGDESYPLFTNRWGGDVVDPRGHRNVERFYLDGTTPVWRFACADALIEKRVFMEQGANTTYVRYRLARGSAPIALSIAALVNYRDFHSSTRGDGWQMRVESIDGGLRVVAFEGAQPFALVADRARAEPGHTWCHRFELSLEVERGLDPVDDNLMVGTFRATLTPESSLTFALSAESSPDRDGDAAWARRQRHESSVLAGWRAGSRSPKSPPWIDRLALNADQFLVARAVAGEPSATSVIAGYPWFADWGRDTMISLPGLALATGRADVARRVLLTFARFVDRGMIPNAFPDSGAPPEYNTVDAALWYVEAVRAYHAETADDTLVKELFSILDGIIACHRDGTRYGIRVDPGDGLLRAGEAGVQLTWMDAKVGDRVVTPRMGKPVEVNALWYNALAAMTSFARLVDHDSHEWEEMRDRAGRGFDRFWNPGAGFCYDVIDGPDGHDASLRPNQIFAVSLPASPLPAERQRQVVDVCARHLLASFGLRSLAPGDPRYRGHYGGGPAERDDAYHQGPVWGWLLGPFALAHFRVYGNRDAARGFLLPMAHHVADYGIGSIAEIFDGDPPFSPRGCFAQAWSVAETLRAWCELGRADEPAPAPRPRRTRRGGHIEGGPRG
jgi:predicted glycogen debranching enzyme